MQLTAVEHPDSKDHGANMGPIWGRQDPGGPHVGPINFALWAIIQAMALNRQHAITLIAYPDSKVRGANMGPIWG